MLDTVRFLIPSYKRAGRVKTINALMEVGVPASQITLSTQTPEDKKAYEEAYGATGVKLIHREGKGVAHNRNTLLQDLELGQRWVMIDDDITNFTYSAPQEGKDWGRTVVLDAAGFAAMIELGFTKAQEMNAGIWGVHPSHNNVRMMGAKEFKQPNRLAIFIAGTWDERSIFFDTTYTIHEDDAFNGAYIMQGRAPMRLWRYGMNSAKQRNNPGGCFDAYQSGGEAMSKEIVQRLLKEFPGVFEPNKEVNNVRLARYLHRNPWRNPDEDRTLL